MKKSALILVGLSLLFFGCNKNQKIVKELEGTWIVSAETQNGVATPAADLAGVKYTFEKCKVKKEDCDGTLSAPDPTKGSISMPFTYSISDKGKKIKIMVNFMGIIAETIDGTIKEHSDDKFVFEFTESGLDSNGVATTYNIVETLSKQ